MTNRSSLRLISSPIVHILRSKSQNSLNRTIEFWFKAPGVAGRKVGHCAVRGLADRLVRNDGAAHPACFAFPHETAAKQLNPYPYGDHEPACVRLSAPPKRLWFIC